VRLVGTHLDRDIIDRARAGEPHPRLGIRLPDGVTFLDHEEFRAWAANSDLVILGVSSAGIAWAIDRLCEALTAPVPVVLLTKGMHAGSGTLQTLPDRLAEEIGRRSCLALATAGIAGPCIAGELAARRQTGTVIASRDVALAHRLCEQLETDYYHPRASSDLVGVELCAAFKNFFAIAVGWAVGRLEVMRDAENRAANHNSAAMLFDQSVRELAILVRSQGGSAESVWGMPGVGDLHVTCQAGRNSRLGNHLGRGLTYRQARAGPMQGETIEGAELGVSVATTLRDMMATGGLDAAALPLTRALLDALTGEAALEVPWTGLHRHW
jgi:glycerol-3-phosphate dehydrogenase (NAD(P)+)